MRFKELRGLMIALLLMGVDIALIIYCALNSNQAKLIIAGALGFGVLLNAFTSYYVRIFEDYMMLYQFVGILFIPKIVEYKEIKKVTLKSNRHLMISTDLKDYHVYITQASRVYEYINERLVKGE